MGTLLGFSEGSIELCRGTLGQTPLERFNFLLVHFDVERIGGTDPKKFRGKIN
jgi:hypothetical protein